MSPSQEGKNVQIKFPQLPNLRLLGDAHIFCWHERHLARARNTYSYMLLSAGEGWGEGLTQIAYVTLSRDLVPPLSAIPFAGEGIVLPGLLFPRRYRRRNETTWINNKLQNP